MQPSAPSVGGNLPVGGSLDPCALLGIDEQPECRQEQLMAGGSPVGGQAGGQVGGATRLGAALDQCCGTFDQETCFDVYDFDLDPFVLSECARRSSAPLLVTAATQATATPATGTVPPVVRRRRQAGVCPAFIRPELCEALQDVCHYSRVPLFRKKRATCIDAELALSDGNVEAFEVCDDINVVPSLKEARYICKE